MEDNEKEIQASMKKMLVNMRRLRQTLEQVKYAPIAVVGMGCRLPSADSPDHLWQLLAHGVDAVSPVPPDRWDAAATYAEDPTIPGKTYVKSGSFLSSVDQFDPRFFNISPREASGIDPQQRLLLEVVWEALEHAAIRPSTLMGSKTGVFIGQSTDDYAQRTSASPQLEQIDAYNSIGTHRSVSAGRISYWLGLQGVAFQLDTACSSSLLTIHLAVQHLRSGDINCAIAGGVNLMLSPNVMVSLSKLNALTPDGRCRSFDASGDGYGRGEGCGIVVLKRLADAQADGDNILGVILGSAANQDGQSNGLTAPNGKAQESLIRAALANARLRPQDVQFIEAHGTSTPLGDPVEIHALGRVYGESRSDTFSVGSIKSNIGHLEAAGGVAGFLKVVQSLRHQHIPPNLHFKTPNPYISWNKYPLQIPTELTPWVAGEKGRVAGVSSFGLSGTNIHIIVAEAPPPPVPVPPQRSHHLLPLSARNHNALQKLATVYQSDLTEQSTLDLNAVCATVANHRTHFPHRLALVGDSFSTLLEQVDAQIENSVSRPDDPLKLTFLFTGQGAHYEHMARDLYREEPYFREIIDQCDRILQEREGIPTDFLTRTTARYLGQDQTHVLQITLFTLQYALGKLWQSWGIQPDFMLGHSIGEYAAACLAGVFSLEDALHLVSERGRLVQLLPSNGSMVSVFASADIVRPYLEPYPEKIVIATINTPDSVVVSGEKTVVEAVLQQLETAAITYRRLNISYSSHSPLVEPMVPEFRRAAQSLTYHLPTVPIISTMLGRLVSAEIATPEYWVNNILNPVLFADALDHLATTTDGNTFLEIGPKATLIGMAQSCLPGDSYTWLTSLHPKQPGFQKPLTTLGTLYERGVEVNWEQLYPAQTYQKIHLPTYQFDRQRYWIEPLTPTTLQPVSASLLGTPIELPGTKERRFSQTLSTNARPFLADYRLHDTHLVPFSLYIACAANELPTTLQNVTLEQPVLLSTPCETQFTFTPDEAEEREQFCAYQRMGDNWARVFSAEKTPTLPPPPSHGELDFLQTTITTPSTLYEKLHSDGFDLGAQFEPIEQLWQTDNQVLAKVVSTQRDSDTPLQPTQLSGCFQTVLALLSPENGSFIPFGAERLQLFATLPTTVWVHAQLVAQDQTHLEANLHIFADDGALIAIAEGLRLRAVDAAALGAVIVPPADWFYTVEWEPLADQGVVSAEFAPTPHALTTDLTAQLDPTERRVYADSLAELNRLASAYTLTALTELGWVGEIGAQYTTIEIADQLGVPERYHRLLVGVLEISAEQSPWLQHSGDSWTVLAPLPVPDPTRYENSLTTYSDYQAERRLLMRCGQSLGAILAGKVDPIQLIFPDGDHADVTHLYKNSLAARVMNGLASDALCRAVDALPTGRTLRILEIGAGTGSTTLNLLPHLPAEQTDYLFTDLSILLVEQARERFKAYPFVEYALLDIDDPFADGTLHPQQFDLIIAANVIHATRDVRHTLGHVRDLLAPNGILFMLEGTQRQAWVELIFGLTEGWVCYEDVDLRSQHPLLSPESWQTIMSQVGFVSAESVVPADNLFCQSLIVAQAPAIPLNTTADEWLILSHSDPVSHQISEQLTATGHHAHHVTPDQFNAETLQQRDSLRGIICYLSDDLQALLAAVQTILASDNKPPALWFLTEGSMGGDSPLQAAVWGFARVLREEHPEIDVRLLDMNVGENMARLVAALSLNTDELALQNGQLFTPKLERLPLPEPLPEGFIRPNKSYLITGGLGGLGLLMAQWLVEQGAGEVVLIGRSAPTPEQQTILDTFADRGTIITTAQVDVTQRDQFAPLIAQYAPTLAGVIHSAGRYADNLIYRHEWSRFNQALTVKVDGAHHLDQLTTDLDLDFFVLFSSISAFFGKPGLSNYAAANTAIDAIAHARQRRGLPALSLNWSAWENTGMAQSVGEEREKVWIASGLTLLDPARAVAAFSRALAAKQAQIAIFELDWPYYAQQLTQIPSLFSRFSAAKIETRGRLKRELEQLPTNEQPRHLEQYLLQAVAHTLGFAHVTDLNKKQGFFDLGMDSLLAMEVRNQLQTDLAVILPPTLLFKYPTVVALTQFLAEDILQLKQEVGLIEEEPAYAPDTSTVSQLDEADLAALIDAELEKLL